MYLTLIYGYYLIHSTDSFFPFCLQHHLVHMTQVQPEGSSLLLLQIWAKFSSFCSTTSTGKTAQTCCEFLDKICSFQKWNIAPVVWERGEHLHVSVWLFCFVSPVNCSQVSRPTDGREMETLTSRVTTQQLSDYNGRARGGSGVGGARLYWLMRPEKKKKKTVPDLIQHRRSTFATFHYLSSPRSPRSSLIG